MVNKHTLFPREPDLGFKTTDAFDADVTDFIKLAETAYDAETACVGMYNDPEPNGYTLNILCL